MEFEYEDDDFNDLDQDISDFFNDPRFKEEFKDSPLDAEKDIVQPFFKIYDTHDDDRYNRFGLSYRQSWPYEKLSYGYKNKKYGKQPVFGQTEASKAAPEMPKPEFKQTFGQPEPEMPKPPPPEQQTFGQQKPSAETPKAAPHFTRIMDFFAPAPSPAAPAIPKTRPQSLGEHKGGVFNAAYQANNDSAYI